MIRLLLSPGDLERMRFAYSPLTEVAASLSIVYSGQIPTPHQAWFEQTRKRLRQVDVAMLRAVIPAPRSQLASFLVAGARTPSTAIEAQLKAVADTPAAWLRADLEAVWNGELPPETEQVLAHGGGPRIADSLWQYWNVAIKPYWPKIRALLGADVAYRTSRLAAGGIQALLADLHPDVELAEHTIRVPGNAIATDHPLGGVGLLLVPCAFAWPRVMADVGAHNAASITYCPRGIGERWLSADIPARSDNVLAALLGRSQATILAKIGLPTSTSDLARELNQSLPTVGAPLAAMRRSGLVTSCLASRRVLYQRTALATSVVAASVSFPHQAGPFHTMGGVAVER